MAGINVALGDIRDFIHDIESRQNDLENCFREARDLFSHYQELAKEKVGIYEEQIRVLNDLMTNLTFSIDELEKKRAYLCNLDMDVHTPGYQERVYEIDEKITRVSNKITQQYAERDGYYQERDGVQRKIDSLNRVEKETQNNMYSLENAYKHLCKVLDKAHERGRKALSSATELAQRLTGGSVDSQTYIKIDDFEAIVNFADRVEARKYEMKKLMEDLRDALGVLHSSLQDRITDVCQTVTDDIDDRSDRYFDYLTRVTEDYRIAYNISKRYR